MENKFTPGPWRVNEYRSILSDKEYIATTNTVPEGATANAHLIASAPAMYREIEIAERFLTDSGYDKVDPSEPEYQMLMSFRKTLAQARGEVKNEEA